MTKKSLSLAIMASILVGCGAPKPVQLDKNSALTINNSILEKKYSFVPKDPFLNNFNWTYNIVTIKNSKDDDFIRNDMVVKTFLLAHNASKIILVGREDLIKEYKEYFLKNQVEALIELQSIEPIAEDYNAVNMLFFHSLEKE